MIDLLERKNYIVSVKKTHRGCWVGFPKTTLINPDLPDIRFEYTPVYGKKETTLQVMKSGDNRKDYEVILPNYCVRNYIGLDIYTAMQQLGLSPAILCYYNESGEKVTTLNQILADMDVSRESFLTEIYLAGEQDGFDKYLKVAKQHKVLDGYKLLVEAFS